MSRRIIDSLVQSRCKELGLDVTDLLMEIPFDAITDDSFDKVKLEKSTVGLGYRPITASLDEKFKMLKVNSDDGYFSLNGKKIPCTGLQARVVKALLLEQVNKNVEYVEAISYCMENLIVLIAKKDLSYDIKPKDDFTEFQKVIVKATSGYIKDKLIFEG